MSPVADTMPLSMDPMSLTVDTMILDVDAMPMSDATTSPNPVTTSVATSTTMPSLIIRLPLDIAKVQHLLSPTTSSKPRTLRKRASPAVKKYTSRLSKKRSIDEETDFELNDDDQSMDIDSENLPGQKPSKRVRGQTKKVQSVPYYGNKTSDMPDPHGKPLVWADKRQQLCETLPNYRAYQSGAYTNNGVLHGFLIDAEVGPLDKFDDQIIITTV